MLSGSKTHSKAHIRTRFKKMPLKYDQNNNKNKNTVSTVVLKLNFIRYIVYYNI